VSRRELPTHLYIEKRGISVKQRHKIDGEAIKRERGRGVGGWGGVLVCGLGFGGGQNSVGSTNGDAQKAKDAFTGPSEIRTNYGLVGRTGENHHGERGPQTDIGVRLTTRRGEKKTTYAKNRPRGGARPEGRVEQTRNGD